MSEEMPEWANDQCIEAVKTAIQKALTGGSARGWADKAARAALLAAGPFCRPEGGGGALRSSDGAFICTPKHAVEAAYLLSTAEAALIATSFDRRDIANILLKFCECEITFDDAMAALREEDTPPVSTSLERGE